MDETFGQWLARRRKTAGLNQTELAERARVSKATISLYEKDSIDQPRKHQVAKIAKALGVPIEEANERAYGVRSSAEIKIGDRAMVKLSDQDLSPKDQEEIAEELALAYELIMARRKAKKAKTE